MAVQFNDLGDYFKSGLTFQDLYKLNNFGNTLLPQNTNHRVEALSRHRKQTRGDTLLKRRKISLSKMSPYTTPNKKQSAVKTVKDVEMEKAVEDRRAKLERWRQTKLAKQQMEKEKKKPPFKVGVVSAGVAAPMNGNLDFSRQINISRWGNVTQMKTFNIPDTKTVRLRGAKKEQSESVSRSNGGRLANSTTKTNNKKVTSVSSLSSESDRLNEEDNRTYRCRTRSQTHAMEAKNKSAKKVKQTTSVVAKKPAKQTVKPEPKQKNKQRTVSKKNEKENKPITENTKTIAPSSATKPKVTPVKPEERPILAEITPEKTAAAVYISPFVTVSRGKNSARKEYQKRRSLNDSQNIQLEKDVEVYTSPKAGAAYFLNILNENISHLQDMCKEWETYKEQNSPPEEACDMINVAIGQSQLLITKKFEQFRSLINRCAAKDPDAPVTCEDLHGFWDMVYMQVVNLHKRFDNLKTLKENNWIEIIPEKKEVKKVKAIKKKAVKPTSNLKDIIKAARQLKKEQETLNTFDAGFFSVTSPAKRQQEKINTPRRSTRKRLLTTSVDANSPGLQMLRASLNIKQIAEGKTPVRSILKSDSCTMSAKKTVLFQDPQDKADTEIDNKGSEKTPRRSRRLSKCTNKLF